MSIEQQLADLFEDQGRHAPETSDLLGGTLRKVRSRRWRVAGAVAAGAAVVCAVALWPGPPRDRVPNAAGAPALHWTVPAGLAGQALPDLGTEQSCVYGYSPELIAEKSDFAFDGTVTAIGPSVSYRPGAPQPWIEVGVTLRVNEWFKGGTSQQTVTVDMPPSPNPTSEKEGSPTGYGVGTRMLVSGAARWGGSDPLAYPVAWWGCGGFTRYYSADLAAQWRAAMR